MALNLLVVPPMTMFPADASSFTDAIYFAITGGDYVLTAHFTIDMGLIAMAAVSLALALRKSIAYKALSIAGFIFVLFAFASGLRFAATNFNFDDISYQMAGGFIVAFSLYFVMAMLMYRDIAVQAGKA